MLGELGIYGTPATILAIIIAIIVKVLPIVAIGPVIYVAVKLAIKHGKRKEENK